MYTVYVIYSTAYDKIYIGSTSNIVARIQSHNSPKNSGYTKRFQPWTLVYSEQFDTKSMAMKREKELKSSKGRDFIRNKIISLINISIN